MSIKEIIDAERWDRNVFDPLGRHNNASMHNASLEHICATYLASKVGGR